MSTALLPSPREQSAPEVITRGEIAAIERQLALIDARNAALYCVSNWIAVFNLAQEVCDKFEELRQNDQHELASLLKSALEKVRDRGVEFAKMASLDVLAITDAHFKIGTGHTQSDLAACIQYLNDRIKQWFVPETAGFDCSAFLAEGGHAAERSVS